VILKQLQTHFKVKHEKGVGTAFPRVRAPLHPDIVPTFFTTITTHNSLIMWKSDIWTYTTRHVGRAGYVNAGPSRAKSWPQDPQNS